MWLSFHADRYDMMKKSRWVDGWKLNVGPQCRRKCGTKLPFDERDAHEETDCINIPYPCVNGCGEMLFPPDVKQRHEKYFCGQRPVHCFLGCGISGLVADTRIPHEQNDCPLRIVTCRHGCGLEVQAKDREFHEEASEWGVCPKRPVRCRHGAPAVLLI
jgi:hypothetical protein